jgi:N-methylhydantoinase A
LKHDYVRTFTRDFDKLEVDEVNEALATMEEAARDTLRQEGVAEERIRIEFSIDLRYIGQHNEVEVPVAADRLTAEGLEAQANRFHARHDALYGYAMPGAPVELINLRVKAIGLTDKPRFESTPAQGEDPAAALKGYRDAFFDGSMRNTPVYDGMKMGNGNRLNGPAIIEQPNTTILVAPGYSMVCDSYSNYLMFPQGRDVAELVAALRNK